MIALLERIYHIFFFGMEEEPLLEAEDDGLSLSRKPLAVVTVSLPFT
jgi:hypothetical protein